MPVLARCGNRLLTSRAQGDAAGASGDEDGIGGQAMRRRTALAGGAASLAAGLARPAIAQGSRVLKFVPQANLSSPDPIWTTTTVAVMHGYMVWDTLYGLDEHLLPQPQMLAGHDVSQDGLVWRLTLRDGLRWTDGAPVLARDCVASIRRWARRDGFGQRLIGQTAELAAESDRVIRFRLTRPFPQLPYALGASSCFKHAFFFA